MFPEVPSTARLTNSFAGAAGLSICRNFIACADSGVQIFAAAEALQGMSAIVAPDTPIVAGLALGVLSVFVVEEGDNRVHHGPGHRKAGAENRPRKLQGEVCANARVGDEISRPAPMFAEG